MELTLRSTIVIKRVSDEVVFAVDLLNETDNFIIFKGVSSLFLNLISEKKSFDEIIKAAFEAYETSEETLRKDFQTFQQQLIDLKFLA